MPSVFGFRLLGPQARTALWIARLMLFAPMQLNQFYHGCTAMGTRDSKSLENNFVIDSFFFSVADFIPRSRGGISIGINICMSGRQ